VPLHGSVTVYAGDTVQADSVIGQMNPQGNMTTHCVARELDISPFDVPAAMHKAEGENVFRGEVIARARGLFSRKEFVAPEDGILERISPYTGWITLRGAPMPILAGYPGIVERVLADQGVWIRSQGALIQGVFGIGGKVAGPIEVLDVEADTCLTAEHVLPSHEGSILVGGARVTPEFLRRATRIGCKAVITGGIHKTDLDQFLGYCLGVAITGLENTMVVILTEGFGHLPMREEVKATLRRLQHRLAYVSGATQIRSGVIRPEVFVPECGNDAQPSFSGSVVAMGPGVRVRVIRAPHFGQVGVVVSEPVPVLLPTECHVLAARVRFTDGEVRFVPAANLEPIGG
jgi:hypothetical protein